jgi:hypothetical protein
VTGGQTEIKNSYFNEELKNNSWSIGAGYDINKYLAAELAYQSLGNRSYKYNSSVSAYTTSESVTAWTGSLLARYPVGNYIPYVRLGYSKVNVDMDGSSLGFASSNSVNTPLYGLGVEMKLDELASIRLEYSTTNSSASWGGTTKINTFQGGVVIRF